MSEPQEYDLTTPPPTPPKPPVPVSARPLKPGDPGWVPPTVIVEKADDEAAPAVDPDIEKHRGVAILAYVCFLIPLIIAPNSKFARFHANQGLLCFISWFIAIFAVVALNVAAWAVDKFVSIIILHHFFSCIFWVLQPLLLLGVLALTIFGIVQAANGEKKPLPLVGQFSLIK